MEIVVDHMLAVLPQITDRRLSPQLVYKCSLGSNVTFGKGQQGLRIQA